MGKGNGSTRSTGNLLQQGVREIHSVVDDLVKWLEGEKSTGKEGKLINVAIELGVERLKEVYDMDAETTPMYTVKVQNALQFAVDGMDEQYMILDEQAGRKRNPDTIKLYEDAAWKLNLSMAHLADRIYESDDRLQEAYFKVSDYIRQKNKL